MTTEHEASRTLVKSPPELWAECSVAESLARHLAGSFGEIRITRLEPETAVAWEGEQVSGTVRLEPSGWGTRVTLTAETEAVEEVEVVDAEPPVLVEAEVVVDADVGEEAEVPSVAERPAEPVMPRPRSRFLERLRAFFKGPEPVVEVADDSAESSEPVSEPEPPPVAEEPVVEESPVATEPDPEPPAPDPPAAEPAIDPEAVLTAALDSLGQAHHRPFSRG
jgi:hypothetical protein